MNPLILTILIGFAGYRITRLLTADTITEGVRDWLHEYLPERVAEGATCGWCLSVWITGVLVAAVWALSGSPVVLPGLIWPAAATISGILASHYD